LKIRVSVVRFRPRPPVTASKTSTDVRGESKSPLVSTP
jgi:hypothetical protein